MDNLNETPKKPKSTNKIEAPIRFRVMQFAKERGIKLSQLSVMLEVSGNYFRQDFEIGTNVLTKLLRTYPEISPDWLLLGMGKMYRGENSFINKELLVLEGESEVSIKATDLARIVNETMSTLRTALELNGKLLEARDREISEKEKEIKQLTNKKR